MIVYNLLALFLFSLSVMFGRSVRERMTLYYLILLFLFVFVAFRFEVGCDWTGYIDQFQIAMNAQYSDLLEGRDVLWWSALVFQSQKNFDYPVINLLPAAIFFAGAHALARRQPDRVAFLTMLFPILIINLAMSGVRQAAACGLLCFAYIAFIQRRPSWFVVWVVLAAGFHSSAAVFLLLFPIAGGRMTSLKLAIGALLAIPGVYTLLQSQSGELAINRYVGGEDAFGAAFRLGTLLITGLYFQLVLKKRWAVTSPEDYPLINLMSWVMIAIIVVVPFSSVIGDRYGYYLMPLQVMILARIPFLDLKNAKLQRLAPYGGLLLFLFGWTFNSMLFDQCFVPYQTWFFGYPVSTVTPL